MINQGQKLNIGCGPGSLPKDWINIDGSWNAKLTKFPLLYRALQFFRLIPANALIIPWDKDVMVRDITKGIPFPDNSISAIYTSHMLEHLYLSQANYFFQECIRVLQPGATLRIVVPDLYTFVVHYQNQKKKLSSELTISDLFPADELNLLLHLRNQTISSENPFIQSYHSLKDFHTHKWMYDADSLSGYFKRHGFMNVEEKGLYQSSIEGINFVEKPDRLIGGAGICVEGQKPKIDQRM